MKQLVFLTFLIACTLSCTRHAHKGDMNATQARAIMDDISRRNLAMEPLKERDDTMMQRVVDYYNRKGTANERMEAYYLLGSVYRDLHEAPKAVEAFLMGIDAADTLAKDCRYDILARLYGQKYNISYRQYLYDQAIIDNESVIKYAQKANDSLYIISSGWTYLGLLYSKGDMEAVANGCWTMLKKSSEMGCYKYAASRLNTCILANIETDNIVDAAKLISIYEQHGGCVDLETYECSFPIYYYAKGRLLLAQHKADSAEMFFRRELKEADWNNRQAAYRGLREVYEQKHQADSALKYARLQCEAVDSDYQHKVTANVQNLEQLYDYSRAQEESHQKQLQLNQTRHRIVALCWALGLLGLAAIFLFYYLRTRYQQRLSKAELELGQVNAALAEKETEENRRVAIARQEELDRLQRWGQLKPKTLRQMYHGESLFQALLGKVKSGMVVSEEELAEVQRRLEAKDDTLMRRFYEQVPMLTNVEKQVVLLLRYGLSKTEVAFLLSRTVQSVVNTCNRLYDKSHENECNSSREAYEWIMNI